MKKLIRITTIPLSLDKLIGEQLTYINQFYEVIAVSADKSELEKVANKYGVQNHHIEMTRTISPIKDLIAVWRLYKFLKKEKPQIVHSHTPKAGIVGMMAAILAGVPNRFHTVAGLPLLEAVGIKRKILNAVESLTYRFATRVFPNSFGLQEIILKKFFSAQHKIKVLGPGSSNGIDTNHFNISQISSDKQHVLKDQLGLSASDFIFIFVGRLVSDKGVNELVNAFKSLQSKIKEFSKTASPNLNLNPHDRTITTRQLPTPKLLLVGPLENDLDALLPQTLLEIEQNESIINVGYQSDVRPYFAIADVLTFPSYREGLPNVVLQSLAMQLPAIVTNINGCNEIITHAQNGLIIPPKDHTFLQHAMEQLITNPSLYHHLKSNSRDSIAPYEQSLIWSALLAEYQSVVKD